MSREEIDEIWLQLMSVRWEIHPKYGQTYLSEVEYEKQMKNISKLRAIHEISTHERVVFSSLLRLGRKHRLELQEILRNQPRRDAQKFIGNKDIRKKIFEIYGEKCLCCGAEDNISLDHVIPVFHGGDNTIENLQPLCTSCNSSKGIKIIDYRKEVSNG